MSYFNNANSVEEIKAIATELNSFELLNVVEECMTAIISCTPFVEGKTRSEVVEDSHKILTILKVVKNEIQENAMFSEASLQM